MEMAIMSADQKPTNSSTGGGGSRPWVPPSTVVVPRWALQFVMQHGYFCDRGPYEEGWPSDEMEQAIKAIKEAMKNHG